MEKPAEGGGAPLGARLKLCEGDTRTHRIGRAIIIIGNPASIPFIIFLIKIENQILRFPNFSLGFTPRPIYSNEFLLLSHFWK